MKLFLKADIFYKKKYCKAKTCKKFDRLAKIQQIHQYKRAVGFWHAACFSHFAIIGRIPLRFEIKTIMRILALIKR